jgi:hypothetical protein
MLFLAVKHPQVVVLSNFTQILRLQMLEFWCLIHLFQPLGAEGVVVRSIDIHPEF